MTRWIATETGDRARTTGPRRTAPARPGTPSGRTCRPRPGQRGQAFAEFGIAAFLIALMLAGVLEFGRAWSAVDTLQAAVREGARTAAVTNPLTRDTAARAALRTVAATHFKEDEIAIDISSAMLAGTQPVVTVSATGNIDLLFADLLSIGTVVDGKRVIQFTRSTTLPDEWIKPTP